MGCGNGRDSLFFHSKGINITAVDASEVAVNKLKNLNLTNADFFCGDFVNSDFIYSKKYDYCYSRFSLHAISEMQENILLQNVAQTLNPEKKKGGGKVFY